MTTDYEERAAKTAKQVLRMLDWEQQIYNHLYVLSAEHAHDRYAADDRMDALLGPSLRHRGSRLSELQSRDLREQPLAERRVSGKLSLKRINLPAGEQLLKFCADVLLAECARRGLEGIVCKRKDSVYRSGPRSGWVKVKTDPWKLTNKDRGEFFEKA